MSNKCIKEGLKDLLHKSWTVKEFCELIPEFKGTYERSLALDLDFPDFMFDLGNTYRQYGAKQLKLRVDRGLIYPTAVYGTTKLIDFSEKLLAYYRHKYLTSLDYYVTEVDDEYEPDSISGLFNKNMEFMDGISHLKFTTKYPHLFVGSLEEGKSHREGTLDFYSNRIRVVDSIKVKRLGIEIEGQLFLSTHNCLGIEDYFKNIFSRIQADTFRVYIQCSYFDCSYSEYAQMTEKIFELFDSLGFKSQVKSHLIVFQFNVFSYFPDKEYKDDTVVNSYYKSVSDLFLKKVTDRIDNSGYCCTYDA